MPPDFAEVIVDRCARFLPVLKNDWIIVSPVVSPDDRGLQRFRVGGRKKLIAEFELLGQRREFLSRRGHAFQSIRWDRNIRLGEVAILHRDGIEG